MSHRDTWQRVRRDRRCPICERPDWCLVAADGSAAICARIESDRPAGLNGAGWLHRLTDERHCRRKWTPLPPPKPKPSIDWARRAKSYVRHLTDAGCERIASTIGVAPATIRTMGVGWCPRRSCWTWPMRDADGRVVGIRTRTTRGKKFADRHSDGNGLFIGPMVTSDYLIVVEGPTDTATMIDIGYQSAIGRPSCRGGTGYIIDIVRRLRPSAILLVPDRDQPGIDGATDLAARIVATDAIPPHRIDALLPPADATDARAWAQKNRDDLAGRIAARIEAIKSRTGDTRHDYII